jgi:hypothetical protein
MALLVPHREFIARLALLQIGEPRCGTGLKIYAARSKSGTRHGKEQCKKLQNFIMSMETAKDFSGLFELTTAR